MSRYIKPLTIAGVPFHLVALSNKDVLKVSLVTAVTAAMLAPAVKVLADRHLRAADRGLLATLSAIDLENELSTRRWSNYYTSLEAL